MHNNYYFFIHLASELNQLLEGAKLLSCYSQNKDELILHFDSERIPYLKASLTSDLVNISFPKELTRAKRNSVELMPELKLQGVSAVKTTKNDRSFYIIFENKKILLFKMHGNYANIMLYDQSNDYPLSIFKKNLKKDKEQSLYELGKVLNPSKEALNNANGNYKQLYPTFGKVINEHLQEINYQDKSREEQWGILSSLEEELLAARFYIKKINNIPRVLLFKQNNAEEQYQSAIETCNMFHQASIKYLSFDKGILILEKKIQDELNRNKNYIKNNYSKLDLLISKTSYKEIADIIMANLHAISSNTKEATLLNFYNGKEIKIKLKPNQSPQDNAHNYYRKSKNQAIETNALQENISTKEQRNQLLTNSLEALKSQDNSKSLRNLEKNLYQKASTKSTEEKSFKRVIYQGYDIFIGKDAKNNDLLTFKFAHKNDLWLHAKDVGGSHVLIRNKGSEKYPNNIIEYAASIAAHHSKKKNTLYADVLYTLKKYVRKPKGAKAGSVITERSKTILVSPLKV